VAALFTRRADRLLRAALALGALLLVGVPTLVFALVRSPLITNQFDPIEQPVAFDHRHHVQDDGIDCRYCHDTVERSPAAGVPSTSVCMGCHGQVWNQSPQLELVRRSYFENRPIRWNRVHRLPDYAYFNHAIHVKKGVACETCHGHVEDMAAVYQVAPLTMGFCVDCHRAPGIEHVRHLEHCSTCHR
jgi:hypothetical protein